MATVKLDKDNIESTINQNKIVLVDFWADWCMPCKMIAPVLEKVSNKYLDQIVIGKLNIEDDGCRPIAQKYQVSSIPTILVFHNKQMVSRLVAPSQTILTQTIQALLK